MSYRICSFNVRRSLRYNETDRDFFALLNQLAHEEGIDIFAFQEATNPYFAERIISNLPRYQQWTSDFVEGSEFQFVWRADRVKPSALPFFNIYESGLHIPRETEFKHKPLYGRFIPEGIGPNVEFRLVNVHVEHGNPIDRRRDECRVLKDDVHREVDAKSYSNGRCIFSLILGDYNLDCENCNDCGPQNVQTIQEQETTLRAKDPWGYSNSYDHFSFDVMKNGTVPCEATRIDAIEYVGGGFERYLKQVSDHVPVRLEIY